MHVVRRASPRSCTQTPRKPLQLRLQVEMLTRFSSWLLSLLMDDFWWWVMDKMGEHKELQIIRFMAADRHTCVDISAALAFFITYRWGKNKSTFVNLDEILTVVTVCDTVYLLIRNKLQSLWIVTILEQRGPKIIEVIFTVAMLGVYSRCIRTIKPVYYCANTHEKLSLHADCWSC